MNILKIFLRKFLSFLIGLDSEIEPHRISLDRFKNLLLECIKKSGNIGAALSRFPLKEEERK